MREVVFRSGEARLSSSAALGVASFVVRRGAVGGAA